MSFKRSNQPKWASVLDLFQQSVGSKFVIPVYQRNYVWEAKKEVKTLLDDYYQLIGTDKTHFLGILIDYLAEGSSTSHKYYVIDGQQRLTTLFLLIRSLKQRATNEKNEDQLFKLNLCLNVHIGSQKNNEYKLEPLMSDGDVFKKILDGKFEQLDEKEKESKVGQAYLYISNFVNNVVKNVCLSDLVDSISRLYLVEIPLDKDDNAQQIFESINFKGTALLATDLIRNYILMCTEDDKKDETFLKKWQPLEAKFSSSQELEKFFRFFIMNQNREFVNKKDVYNCFREWVDIELNVHSMDEVIDYIDKYATSYDLLYKKDLLKEKDEDIWKALKDYRNIKSEMPAPLMLEITTLFSDGEINKAQFIQVIYIIDTFILRRAIIGMDTSGITRFFTSVIKTILSLCEDSYANLVDVVKYCVVDDNKNKASRMPDDSEIINDLKTLNVYDNSLALHCFFDRYENEKMTNPVQTMNYQIEHIMPQDGKKWLSVVDLSEEEYNFQTGRLGNLTLTTKHDNPSMSNNLFDYKQVILKDTAGFRLNVPVYSSQTWDVDSINKRNESLSNELIRLYPYEPSQNSLAYKSFLLKNKNTPKMDKLIEWGIINCGDEVYLKRYKESSKAVLKDAGTVLFNGELLKLSQWVSKVYGIKAGVNYYKEIFLEKGLDSLDSLRASYIKEHQTETLNGKEGATFRELLSLSLNEFISSKAETDETIIPLTGQECYIRFAGAKIRRKVGLNGDGSWSKIKDLIVYEIYNTVDNGVELNLYIGPGKQELRKKWLAFAINSNVLDTNYLKLKAKWNKINCVKLVDSRSNYASDDEYISKALSSLEEFFKTEFIKIEDEFMIAPDDLNSDIYQIKGSDTTPIYDEQYNEKGVEKNIIKLYEDIKEKALLLCGDFVVVPTKVYVAFKIQDKNIFDVEFFKTKLRISLNVKKGFLKDPENKCRDITNIGTHGNGDYDITIDNEDNIHYLLSLISQSVNSAK